MQRIINALMILWLAFWLTGCYSVYGPARLGMNTHVLTKPNVTGLEYVDTAATYGSIDYTRSSYLSDNDNDIYNDIVNAFTARAHRSFIKHNVAFSAGGAFTLGSRTFPYDSVDNGVLAVGKFNHYAVSAFGEVALPLVNFHTANFYPIKAGFFYTYEFGPSMDFLRAEAENIAEFERVYTNAHIPSLTLSHEIMIEVQEDVMIGFDIGQILTLNAKPDYRSASDPNVNQLFYSVRASLLFSADRYTVNMTGVTGLHGGINFGITARLGKL